MPSRFCTRRCIGRTPCFAFLFPPTATGPQGIATWLIWLIGLPLVVGAIVTVMVLRGGVQFTDDDSNPFALPFAFAFAALLVLWYIYRQVKQSWEVPKPREPEA